MSEENVRNSVRRVLQADLEGRNVRSLAFYQRMFFGYDGVVEAEYRRLTESPAPATAAAETFFDSDAGTPAPHQEPHAGAAPPTEDTPEPDPPPAMPDPIRKDDALERLAIQDAARYADAEEIARGGMGAILQVRDEHLNRDLAMKVVLDFDADHDEISTSESNPVLDRFLAEAQVTAQLDHPGVVPVHDLGIDHTGRFFFTMKLVRGRTLSEIFRLVREEAEGWTRPRVVQLMVRVLETLSFAHSKGVVHRDLKPDNIMVGDFGEVYVMDWGLAKVLGGESGRVEPAAKEASPATSSSVEITHAPEATMMGTVMGTPYYMSPEQAAGRRDDLDYRSDVYAAGAILYELLAGTPQYHDIVDEQHAIEIVTACAKGPPTPILELAPRTPAEIVAIVEKAMAREPGDRYATADEMTKDLRDFLEGRVVGAYRTGALIELRKWILRNKALAGAIAAAVVILVAGLLTNLASLAESRREAENARRQAYRFGMSLAARAIGENDPGTARAKLDEVPATARGWEWRYLDARLGDTEFEVDSPLSGFDEHGRLLVVGDDYSIRRIDIDTGAEQQVWPGGGLHALHFLGAGRYVQLAAASGADDEPLRPYRNGVADLATGERLLTVEGKYAYVPAPDRIVYYEEPRWTVFDLKRRKTVAARELERPMAFLDASPDGTLLAGVLADHSVLLVDAGTLQKVARLAGHTERPARIAYAPDGAMAVTCGVDGTARTWLLPSGDSGPWTFEVPGGANLWHVAFHPHGRVVAVSCEDGTIRLLDAADGTVLRHLMGGFEKVEFSPDGNRLITYVGGAHTFVHDTSTIEDPNVLRGHRSFAYDVAFSPDGRRLATAGWDGWVQAPGCVRLWDVASGEQIGAWGADDRCATSIAWSPQGDLLYVTVIDGAAKHDAKGAVCVLDAATGAVVRELRGGSKLALSPDGAWLVAARVPIASGEDYALIHDLKGGAITGRIPHRVAAGMGLGFVSARLVGCYMENCDVLLVDVTTGREVRRLQGHDRGVWSIEPSPDGRSILSAADDGTVRLWDFASGEQLAVLGGHGAGALSATYSPDGTRIASGGRDGRIHVWHATTHQEIVRLLGHTAYVTDVAFSPDGETLASCSGDGTIRLWDAAPTSKRITARRLRKATVAALGPRVTRLFGELDDARAVADRVRADGALSAHEREVALQLVLAESLRRIAAKKRDR